MSGPLSGRRIALTRPAGESDALASLLRERGATVIEAPLLEVLPPLDTAPFDAAARGIGDLDWVAFTSANAVRATRLRLEALGVPLGARVRIACVGPATAASVPENFPGRSAALTPGQDFRAETLVLAFRDVPPGRVLLPVSDQARDVLAVGLRALGFDVRQVVAYRTAAVPRTPAGLEPAEGLDAVVLASPSAVESLVERLGEGARSLPVAAIGPVTAEAARAQGLALVVTAVSATSEGVAAALGRHFGPQAQQNP